MSLQHKVWTYTDYLQLDNDKRYEIIDGELVEMNSPRSIHQKIIMNLGTLINNYLDKNPMGEIYPDLDTKLSDTNVYRPDLLFISNDNLKKITETHISGTPDLLVEVLSQDKDRDRVKKFTFYEQFQVKEYWIIDPDMSSIEMYILKDGKLILVIKAIEAEEIESYVLKGFAISYQSILNRKN